MCSKQIGLEDVRAYVRTEAEGLDPGGPLDPLTASLIELAMYAAVTTLDRNGASQSMMKALDAGASVEQINEVLALVSGLGVHTLMLGSALLMNHASERGLMNKSAPLDPVRAALWEKYVGADPYWTVVEKELPDFLESMLRLSPEMFEGFFAYCAIPWKIGALRARTRELIAFACDCSATHRFMPGLRLHMNNARKLGIGRTELLEAVDIASAAPPHAGVN